MGKRFGKSLHSSCKATKTIWLIGNKCMDTKEIEKIVGDACRAETNVFGYDIWAHHILQVVNIG